MKRVGLVSCALMFWLCQNVSSSELDQWLQDNAVHLETLQTNADYPQLQALDRLVQGKRIVFLGEASHWVHEKYDYRLIILKHLISLGYNQVGMETGLSDGQRVDHFFETGNRTDLNRAALYGYRGPTIRLRTPPQVCPDAPKAFAKFGELFRDEETWFFQELRELGNKKLSPKDRIHYFGFDVDTIPGGGYEDAAELLEPRRLEKGVAEISAALTPVPNETATEEENRLNAVLGLIDKHEPKLTSARLAVETLMESIHFISVLHAKPCDPHERSDWNKQLMDAFARRERMMFKIMRAKLEELGPDAKTVLMGHDMHLSKEPESLRFTGADVPDPIAPPMWPSVGEFVSKTLALPVYSIWMIQAEGTQSNLDCAVADCPIQTGPNYLGTKLQTAGPYSFIPLDKPLDPRAKDLDTKLSFTVNGGTHSGNVSKNADAIFFVQKVSGFKVRPYADFTLNKHD